LNSVQKPQGNRHRNSGYWNGRRFRPNWFLYDLEYILDSLTESNDVFMESNDSDPQWASEHPSSMDPARVYVSSRSVPRAWNHSLTGRSNRP
jgi:hypothetical protein